MINKLQLKAIDPYKSFIVNANAGSGKTFILTRRYLRLLLEGVTINNILCITFTINAANEMKGRIISIIASWKNLDKASLENELLEIGINKNKIEQYIIRARSLFDLVYSNNDEFKIQTIHSFCDKILKSNASLLGIKSNYETISEEYTKLLKQNILDNSFLKFKENNDNEKYNIIYQNYYSIQKNLNKFISPFYSASEFDQLIKRVFEFNNEYKNQFITKISKAKEKIISLNIDPYPKKLLNFLNSSEDMNNIEELFNKTKDIFLTQMGEIRKKILLKAEEKKYPNLPEIISNLTDAYFSYHKEETSRNHLTINSLIEQIITNANEEYKNYLIQNNLIDFDFIIFFCKQLFLSDDGSWVEYKLDNKIDHILLDEYQDTNDAQWEIISRLIENNIYSQHENNKSFFIVGDEKQSIYSFQGVNAHKTNEYLIEFAKLASENYVPFETINFTQCFRSANNIYNFVDEVFDNKICRSAMLSGINADITHKTDNNFAGNIEYWDKPPAKKKEKVTDFFNHEEKDDSDHPSFENEIAEKIHSLIGQEYEINGTRKIIKPNDIMILVRRRSNIYYNIALALRKYEIDFAGFDEIDLSKEIIIKDIINLCRFALWPDDNLLLSILLTGPFFNIDKLKLYEFIYENKGKSLWQNLHRASFISPTDIKRLKEYIKLGNNLSSYDFLEEIIFLSHENLFEKIISRYGKFGEDVITIFIDYVKANKAEFSSIEDFIHFFSITGSKIKRSTEVNAVRLMTIHGAKGLEAPIVFLPDFSPPNMRAKSYTKMDDHHYFYTEEFIRKNNNYINEEIEKNYIFELSEYYRLFYVAITRPISHLYICPLNEKSEIKFKINGVVQTFPSWFDLIETKFKIEQKDTINDEKQNDEITNKENHLISKKNPNDYLDINENKFTKYYLTMNGMLNEIFADEKNNHPSLPRSKDMHTEINFNDILSSQKTNSQKQELISFSNNIKDIIITNFQQPQNNIFDTHKYDYLKDHNKAAEIGTEIHKLFFTIINNNLNNDEILAHLRKIEFLNDNQLNQYHENICNILSNDIWLQWKEKKISSEAEFFYNDKKLGLLYAIIDAIIFDGDNITIIDFKTGMHDNSSKIIYEYQMSFYSYILKNVNCNCNITSYLIYISENKFIKLPKDNENLFINLRGQYGNN